MRPAYALAAALLLSVSAQLPTAAVQCGGAWFEVECEYPEDDYLHDEDYRAYLDEQERRSREASDEIRDANSSDGGAVVPSLAQGEDASAADAMCQPATLIDAFIPDQVRKPCDADLPPIPTLSQDMDSHWWDIDPLLVLPDELLPVCNRWDRYEVYAFADVVKRFPNFADASADLEQLGWRAGAHREYACDAEPVQGLAWLDVSMHLFTERAGATAAVPFFALGRSQASQLKLAPFKLQGDAALALSGPSEYGTEYTLYVAHDVYMLRVSAVAADGEPAVAVQEIATALELNLLP